MNTSVDQLTDFSCLRSRADCSFDLWGGTPPLIQGLANQIMNQGFRLSHVAPVKLLVDLPQGLAFRALKALDGADGADGADRGDPTESRTNRKQMRLVVATFNICPEYWEDLWDMQPDVLLVDPKSERDFVEALVRVAKGESYRVVPGCTTPLNATERRILSFLAHGKPNEEIARHLKVQEKTIINILTRIYRKLHVKSRAEAMLYYWGLLGAVADKAYEGYKGA